LNQQKILIISDIDGTIRDIYTDMAKCYNKKYNKNISIADFYKEIVCVVHPDNVRIIMEVVDELGPSLYENAPADYYVLGIYRLMLKMFKGDIDIIFITTYISDEIMEATYKWVDHHIHKKIPIIFNKLGHIRKEVPQEYMNYDKYLIVDDIEKIAKNLAEDLLKAGKEAAYAAVKYGEDPNVNVEIIRKAASELLGCPRKT